MPESYRLKALTFELDTLLLSVNFIHFYTCILYILTAAKH